MAFFCVARTCFSLVAHLGASSLKHVITAHLAELGRHHGASVLLTCTFIDLKPDFLHIIG